MATNPYQPRALFANRASGDLVEIVTADADCVSFSPQGGGFVSSMSREAFDARFIASSLPATYRKFRFSGEWIDGGSLIGYTDGGRWNGWAIPWVTKEVAESIAGQSNDLGAEGFRFRWVEDQLYVFDPQENEEFEITPQSIVTEEGPLDLYNLGLGWCWEFDGWGNEQPRRFKCPKCLSSNLSLNVITSAKLVQAADGKVDTVVTGLASDSHEWDNASLMWCHDCQHCDGAGSFCVKT